MARATTKTTRGSFGCVEMLCHRPSRPYWTSSIRWASRRHALYSRIAVLAVAFFTSSGLSAQGPEQLLKATLDVWAQDKAFDLYWTHTLPETYVPGTKVDVSFALSGEVLAFCLEEFRECAAYILSEVPTPITGASLPYVQQCHEDCIQSHLRSIVADALPRVRAKSVPPPARSSASAAPAFDAGRFSDPFPKLDESTYQVTFHVTAWARSPIPKWISFAATSEEEQAKLVTAILHYLNSERKSCKTRSVTMAQLRAGDKTAYVHLGSLPGCRSELVTMSKDDIGWRFDLSNFDPVDGEQFLGRIIAAGGNSETLGPLARPFR